MGRQIAIVEDEPAIGENYREFLTRSGYSVNLYANRKAALDAFDRQMPELAIIDVGLGDELEGGFDLCRELRSKAGHLPIIFLTARDSDLDAVSGFRVGADDYLSKEITQEHLLARIIALFRRMDAIREPESTDSDVLRRDHLAMDTARMTTTWRDQVVHLTLTEFWMVHALVLHPGHVKNRQQLMDAANAVLDDNTITSHIKRIRKKFTEVDPDFAAIETNYGFGYRWNSAKIGA